MRLWNVFGFDLLPPAYAVKCSRHLDLDSSFTPSSCRHRNVTGVTLARGWKRWHGGGRQPAVIKGQFILGGAPRGHF